MKNFMQNILQIFKKHSLLLRLLFFGSILVFVINQVVNIAHGMSWQEIATTLNQQKRSALVLMAVIGLVGVLPMLGYDWVTVRTLEKAGKTPMPRGQWFASAWIVNTINNLAGFGGVVGASLRSNFYGKDTTKKDVLSLVSKVAIFMFTGLSVWALFLSVDILLLGHNDHFKSYWIWLVGGSLYAPALVFFSYLRRKKLFKDLFPQGVVALVVTSVAQWTAALLVFLAIGYLMGIHLPLNQVYPMFLIATLIGMLTMVPGGMGTFDVMIILGMGRLGLSQGETVVWLLFYRLFYYLIPFFSGLILFLSRTGVKINRYFDNIPRLALQRIAHFLVVAAVYFAGIMMVLLSTVTNLSTISQIFQVLLPYSFNFLDQTLNLLIGFVLLGLARGLSAKVEKAYLPTIGLLIFGIINTVSRTQSKRLLFAYCAILIFVWLARKEFYRKKFVYSWGAMIVDGLLFGTLVIVYGVAGIHSGEWWNNQVLGGKFMLFPSDDIWFSGFVGLAVAALVLLSLQRYLSATGESLGQPLNAKRYEQLLGRFQGTTSSQRALLPGYQFYYYRTDGLDRLAFAYQIKGNRCFVLGDPVGDKNKWDQGTLNFMRAADRLGYQLAFYRVSEAYAVVLHDLGFHFSKIGENGQVNLNHPDTIQIVENQRKFSYLGYTFSYYPAIPTELLPELSRISASWLGNRSEKNFASGRFDEAYLKLSGIGVVYNPQHKMVGFISEQPVSQNMITYDLLRLDQNVPVELSNYLVFNMLRVWRKHGLETADLGLAPLAKVGDGPQAFFRDRLLHLIYNYGNIFYDFQENYDGKSQLVQTWQGSYFAYPKGGSFYLASLQLLTLIGRGKNKGSTIVEEVMFDEENQVEN